MPSEGEPDDAERQRTMDKLGAHFFWGYSGALDLLEAGGRREIETAGGETNCRVAVGRDSSCGRCRSAQGTAATSSAPSSYFYHRKTEANNPWV